MREGGGYPRRTGLVNLQDMDFNRQSLKYRVQAPHGLTPLPSSPAGHLMILS